jgi:putative ABC transport system permease protein
VYVRDSVTALRSLRRAPGFSLTAVLTLALGIAAATTVFSVSDRLLFRRLPYADPDRLVTVGADVRARGFHNWGVAADEFDAWRQSNRTLADLGGYQTFGRFTISRSEAPAEVAVNRITPNFLNLLGVPPAIGRAFGNSDFVPGAPLALLLTDATWRRLFAADRSIVGRFLTVNGAPAEVAGVLPRSFVFPSAAAREVPDILVPLVRTKASAGSRVLMIGRLPSGSTIETARVEIDAIAAGRRADSGVRNSPIDGATVDWLNEALGRGPRSVLFLLMGAVAALVLIGCVNVANLLLARGADRRGELAVRTALGASRGSLIRLLVIESAVLAFAGGVAGAILAYGAVATIGPLIPPDLQRLGTIAVDGRALLVAASLSTLAVVLAGVGPAFAAAGVHLSPVLAHVSARTTGARWRVRQTLVGLEVALAVVLLIGGGLMVNTMVRVLGVDLGYTPESRLTMRVQLPRGQAYPSRSRDFVERAISAAARVPGVTSAGASEGVPLGNTLYAGHYRVEGFSQEWMRQGAPTTGPCCTQTQWVSADYFEAAGIQIVRGRAFTATDAAAAPAVALISERLARKFPAGMDPIGHYLTAASEGDKAIDDRRLIVGVVRDVRDMSLERQALQAIYLPIEERGAAMMTLVLRTTVDPLSVAGAVQKAVQSQAGPVIISDVLTFTDVMKRSVGTRHLNAWLFGSFGVLGLLLASIGIASVVSYSVARRTREMGLRIALGARPGDVRALVVRESMAPVLAGLVLGIAASLTLSRFVESLLFAVEPRDVWTYAGVCLVLVTAAIVAAGLPARRASRVDPLIALRAE